MPAPKNPKGAKSDKLWREAISLALHEEDGVTQKKKLRRIAEKLVTLAMDGDMQAIKEIGDRMDGKPVQGIAGDSDQPFEHVFRWANDEK